MTVLTQYQRLESPGLWRADSDAQRLNVIVSLGDATLTFSDSSDRALAHWSLPAIHRLNPGQRPALFAPSPEATDTLELDDDTLIEALERLHAIIEKRRPHVGRLRQVLTLGILAMLVLGGALWLPNALISYTVNVVPEATRAAIGQRLTTRIYRISGRSCTEEFGSRALQTLGENLLGNTKTRLIILAQASRPALHLPGHIILVNHAVVDAYDTPYVISGFILAEDARARQTDPMLALLRHAGIVSAIKLLTTGDLSDAVLDRYSEALLTSGIIPLPDAVLLERFAVARIPASPYAFALDPTGETSLPLIEADPVQPSDAANLMSDSDWISLQGICTD